MSNTTDLQDYEGDDVFKILVATDIHLGYNEKDQIRDEDSFIAFEEILKIAVREDVDFILLGGDLFHDCKPSPYCIQKCSELVRKYCFGDKAVPIEFLSDQSVHFKHLNNPVVNYEDPNVNVSIPIFSIHGNHDDPTGNKATSTMDLMATNGLINYFGRWTDLRMINVFPILLKKGDNKLALFGLSHIHDQRLARLFRDDKVSMCKLEEDDWFNLLVLHQNRAHRGANNFIPYSSLPDFMDLVIWGHEHDCLIVPEKQDNNIWITQPGSSVATSLSEGESKPKHVGLLVIKKRDFHLKPIPLETVRPFVFEILELDEPAALKAKDILDLSKHAMTTVTRKIGEIIKQIANERKAKKLPEMLPLIRVVVRYHDEQQSFNPIKLSQNFVGRVANSDDIVLQKKVISKDRSSSKRFMDDTEFEEDEMDMNVAKMNQVKDLVEKEFEKNNRKDKMKVISINGLSQAVQRFVEQKDADALRDIIDYQIKETVDKLDEMEVTVENIDKGIDLLYNKRLNQNADTETNEINKILEDPNRCYHKLDTLEDEDDPEDGDTDSPSTSMNDTEEKPKRGRGRGRAAAAKPRRPRGSRGKRGN